MSIEWHEESLKNQKFYYNALFFETQIMLKRLSTLQQENDFYEYQITEAKKLGKVGFDSYKFKVKKKEVK